jgi:L-alanine-DL-glutamate epimerase-like enolase superfamily enzyme
MAAQLAGLGVEMIEQPFPAGDDAALAELDHPVPIYADESCRDRAGVAALADRYDMINIKLDKTGGLTEALATAAAARAVGLDLMVGCMVGTSLALAPAHLVAQGAKIVDLDGPLLLAEDREPPLEVRGSRIFPPTAALWG